MAPEETGGGSGGAVHATRAQGLHHVAGGGGGGGVTSEKQHSGVHSQYHQHQHGMRGRNTPTTTTTTTGNGSGMSSRAALHMMATESTAAALPESLYTVRWSADEQKLLEDSLRTTEMSCTPLEQYIAVAALLPNKGVRDVALRVRWMNRKHVRAHDVSKKRRADDSSSRRGKDTSSSRRDVGESSWPSGPLFTAVGGIDHGIGGNVQSVLVRTNDLLTQNANIIMEIRENTSFQRISENREMLMVLHDNINQLLLLSTKPAAMNQMPPIPARIDCDLAAAVLHNASGDLNATNSSLMMPNSAMDSNTMVMMKDTTPLVIQPKKENIDGGMGLL